MRRSVRAGRGEPESHGPTTQERPPGGATREAVTGTWLEAPVITSLTDAERAELSRKAAEANKRSEDNALVRGGR